MAASITTLNGLRCTVRPRTQIFTAISPPATTTTATATAIDIPATINTSLSQTNSAAVQNTSIANPVSSILSQPGNSGPASNPTSFVTSAIATSSGATAAAATLSPVFTSLADPSSTPASGSNSSGVTSGSIPSKNVVGAAVGASLGAVAVVLMIILCAFFRRRKRRTPSQLNAGEKGPSARVVAGMKQPRKTASRSIAAFKTGFNDKYQGALAGIRNLRFKKGEDSNDTAAPPPAMQAATSQRLPPFNFSKRTPLVKDNISRASGPVAVSESSNPFADPPSRVGPTTTQNDAVGANPFADSAIEHYNDIPFSLPLTVRNSDMDGIDSVVVVDEDDDDDHDDHDLDRNRHRDQNENQDTTLRGSLFNLNLPDPRVSSPLMPRNWTLTDWSGKDRSSTYSDPFDLERPPTIHSSVHPTPMMERQESEQGGGYFQGLTHGSPVYISG